MADTPQGASEKEARARDSVTQLLGRVRDGDRAALDELVPLVYPELRHMAASYLRTERPNHTLQPTALIHEAYMRIAGSRDFPDFQSRAHFFGIASQVMRQVLVDSARRIRSAKRSLPGAKATFTEALQVTDGDLELVSRIDDALKSLEKRDPQLSRLVEMRFFGGLTAEESAEVLGLPVGQVRRKIRGALILVKHELENPAVK